MKNELQNFIDMLDNADVSYTYVPLGLKTKVIVKGVDFIFDDCNRLLEVDW